MSTNPIAPGTAAIKPEFIIPIQPPHPAPDDDAAEGATSHVQGSTHENDNDNRGDDKKLTSSQRRKLAKEQKKKQRGANKGRRYAKVRDELDLCWRVAMGRVCEFGDECRYTHDILTYLSAKPPDLSLPPPTSLLPSPPFVQDRPPSQLHQSLDPNTRCPIFEDRGHCKYGLKCRFLGGHVLRKKDEETGEEKLELVVDEEKKARTAVDREEMNFADPEALKMLRQKKYPRPITDAYLKELELTNGDGPKSNSNSHSKNEPSLAETDAEIVIPEPEQTSAMDIDSEKQNPPAHAYDASQDDGPDVPARFSEKKRLDWKGKTYLAPLTTVGNLPFRRLCVSLGADITCGEMGLANSFLQGSKEEWSLVRRHPSEKTFGVQLAGGKPSLLVPAAEVIAKECAGNLDFVDLNCGCPIDLVFRTGSGSALLDTPGKLGKILIGMNKALGEIPLTVKLRTGVKEGKNTVHKIMPRLSSEWNASCITLHGRTRQQRYAKLADWDYIKQCVDMVRAEEADKNLPPVPIFGGGDAFSAQDYWEKVEHSGVDGVMVARGALIKPWIFTEIKERREWDISSRERLELIRQYAEYGLSHFGTDTAGINTTRRYLCEALSFQYRYIPIGILERLPPRINDRPPAFRGRDDLETLLASDNSQDWVKISEMFLGPAPETWTFTPKHKSNSYGPDESQG